MDYFECERQQLTEDLAWLRKRQRQGWRDEYEELTSLRPVAQKWREVLDAEGTLDPGLNAIDDRIRQLELSLSR